MVNIVRTKKRDNIKCYINLVFSSHSGQFKTLKHYKTKKRIGTSGSRQDGESIDPPIPPTKYS